MFVFSRACAQYVYFTCVKRPSHGKLNLSLQLRNGERAACGYRVIYARGRLLNTKEA